MDIRQFRSFIAVIDHGSFSAAAEALFTVQSNVSAHVARLEDGLGEKLLDRRTRELTPAGQAVEVRARAILGELSGIHDDLAALENRIIGQVACGTTPAVGLWILPATLAQATVEFPDISITVVEAQSGELSQRVMTGNIDLAINTGPNDPRLAIAPLFDEDIVAVLSPDHPLAENLTLTLAQLATTKLLVPLSDNPLHQHIARAFETAHIPFRVGLEVGSSGLVQAMAGAGVGVALVPASVPDTAAMNQPTVRRTVTDLPPRLVALTTRRLSPKNRAVESIARMIIATAHEEALSMPGCHVHPVDQSNPGVDVLSMSR